MELPKNSFTPEAFDVERIRTTSFVDGVLARLGWERFKDLDVVEAIEIGLTRNQLAYGSRFCPCYATMSYGKADGRKNPAAICPCPAAIRMDVTESGVYGPFTTREDLEDRTRDWPAPGAIEQREEGWVMVSQHAGIDH